MAKQERKEQHLFDVCLQIAVEHREIDLEVRNIRVDIDGVVGFRGGEDSIGSGMRLLC